MADKDTRYELDARGDSQTYPDGVRSDGLSTPRAPEQPEDPDTTRAPRPNEVPTPDPKAVEPAPETVSEPPTVSEAREGIASEDLPTHDSSAHDGSWHDVIADALAQETSAQDAVARLNTPPEPETSEQHGLPPEKGRSDALPQDDKATSFTDAAEGLFRPPTTGPGEDTHLITIGRRLDPSLRIPRPVAPVIEPRHDTLNDPRPQTGVEQDTKDLWKTRLYKAARYLGIALAGYLALVLVLIVLFRFVNPPGSMLMLTQFVTGTSIDRRWASLDTISPALVRAVVVSEDGRFCEHSGIDTQAMKEAIDRASGGVPRGASTISMQVTKNLFLWNAKSYVRKIIEIPLTLFMELLWPKARVLEVYLNIAEWGPGVFGAEAAARHHFNKSAANLNDREVALLAAVLPNPIARDAGNAGSQTSLKARVIQSRVKAYGTVASCVVSASAAQPAAAAAKRSTLRKPQPLRIQPRKKPADDWSPTLNFGN